MNLIQLQRAFLHHILHGDANVAAAINESDRFSAQQRLAVYADAYRLRLIEALAHNYPRLQQLLGETEFSAVALAYLDAQPSHNVSARWFGDQLTVHLRQRHPDRPWLTELAGWEWAIAAAFDAADASPLDDAALAAVDPADWPTLRLQFHPSMQRLRLHTNAPALFKALSDATDCPAPAALPQPQRWLIWRQELTPRYRSLPDDEATALDTLVAQGSFGDACEALCNWHEAAEVPAQIARMLRNWVDEALLVSLMR